LLCHPPGAAFFPFFLVLIAILRPFLPHIFTKHELEVLDSSSVEEDDAASQPQEKVNEDGSSDHKPSPGSKEEIRHDAVDNAATQTKKAVGTLPDLEGLAVGIDESAAGS
jgi:hypothetical protein